MTTTNTLLLTLCLALGVGGCDLMDNNGTGDRPDFAPEGTAYIVGVIEATADTAAFYGPPEVFVGTLDDQKNARWRLLEDDRVEVQHHIWSPTLFGEVVWLLDRLSQRPVGDEGAEVTIVGPLGQSGERSVRLVHKGAGVYADLDGLLLVRDNAVYRLDVTLSDGRRYTSAGYVPPAPRWTVPDSTVVPVELEIAPDNGTPLELGRGEYPEWEVDAPSAFVVTQSNYTNDREVFRLEPGEVFFREDAGDFRREGGNYTIMDGQTDPLAQPQPIWSADCYAAPVDFTTQYNRVSVVGPELAAFYWPELNEYATTTQSGAFEMHVRRVWGHGGWGKPLYEYLHGRANIERVGPTGAPLAHSESDALGVFGGYASIYRQSVMVPDRDFDISAIENWPCR